MPSRAQYSRLNLAIGLLMIALPLFVAAVYWSSKQGSVCAFTIPHGDTEKCVNLEVAETPEARTAGLSDRLSIPEDGGLLFIFESAGNHCIWMKDMHFDIDAVWLDDQKTIVDIKKNISPQTFPESFCPSAPARYVIEVNASVAEKAGLKTGQVLEF